MARLLRGEIYWADLNPIRGREQAGLRPVLILSHELFNRRSETVIAMAIASQPQKAGFPLTFARLGLRIAALDVEIGPTLPAAPTRPPLTPRATPPY